MLARISFSEMIRMSASGIFKIASQRCISLAPTAATRCSLGITIPLALLSGADKVILWHYSEKRPLRMTSA